MVVQLVSRFDLGEIQAHTQIKTYSELWKAVQTAMFHTHVESRLKQDIIEDPARCATRGGHPLHLRGSPPSRGCAPEPLHSESPCAVVRPSPLHSTRGGGT